MKAVGLQSQNKLDEAEKLHLKVLELNERYTPSLQQLAAIYSNQGKHAYAIKYLEDYMNIEGNQRREIVQFAFDIYRRANDSRANQYEQLLQNVK
jgi:lipopolysaccharide biosynthesis regulator YciM